MNCYYKYFTINTLRVKHDHFCILLIPKDLKKKKEKSHKHEKFSVFKFETQTISEWNLKGEKFTCKFNKRRKFNKP